MNILGVEDSKEEMEELRKKIYTGRPFGGERFIKKLRKAAVKILQALLFLKSHSPFSFMTPLHNCAYCPSNA